MELKSNWKQLILVIGQEDKYFAWLGKSLLNKRESNWKRIVYFKRFKGKSQRNRKK